jgi:hypothetical protein
VDLHGHHAGSAGATNGSHVDDGAVLDGFELGRELVLVAVLFELITELEALDEAVACATDFVD